MCGLSKDGESYKPTRPSQIIKSEKLVQSVITVLTEDYIYPFQADKKKYKLICLSSGVSVGEDIADCMLSLEKNGRNQYDEFISKRVASKEVPIHHPIKRNSVKNFNTI